MIKMLLLFFTVSASHVVIYNEFREKFVGRRLSFEFSITKVFLLVNLFYASAYLIYFVTKCI